MDQTFVPAVALPDELLDGRPAWWFALRGTEPLVRETGDAVEIPRLTDLDEIGLAPIRRQSLGILAGTGCWSAELGPDVEPPSGLAFRGLRSLYGRLPDPLYGLAGRAAQVVEWDRTHRFCGRCGAATVDLPGERAKRCPVCGLTSYPRISPATIVLIKRGDEILLLRAHDFPEAFYGLVAGFVEPGESLEEAVVRETQEEVGLQLRDIRYFGSQPWPFPHGLMVGFTAAYAGGELRLQEREVAAAGWFSVSTLPGIPSKLSIARRLVDAFVARQRARDPSLPEPPE